MSGNTSGQPDCLRARTRPIRSITIVVDTQACPWASSLSTQRQGRCCIRWPCALARHSTKSQTPCRKRQTIPIRQHPTTCQAVVGERMDLMPSNEQRSAAAFRDAPRLRRLMSKLYARTKLSVRILLDGSFHAGTKPCISLLSSNSSNPDGYKLTSNTGTWLPRRLTCSKTTLWKPPGTTLRAGARNAPNRPSGSLLGPLCGLALQMFQNDPLEASWDHFAGWRLECSKTNAGGQ